MASKARDLSTADEANPTGVAAFAKEWLDRRWKSICPWASFVDPHKFSEPRNLGELSQRVVRNMDTFNGNYTFIFLGLILYCIISSQMLIIATVFLIGSQSSAAFHETSFEGQRKFSKPRNFGELYQRVVRNMDTLNSIYIIFLGFIFYCIISSPILLGATLFVIGSHAVFREPEAQSRFLPLGLIFRPTVHGD